MLGYRKKSFARAHELLSALRSNSDDFEALRGIQRLLLAEIMRAESKGREIKGQLKAIQDNGGETSQKRAAVLKNRLEKARQAAYVWRCFGDAIAFNYMDRFALKQSFYSTHSTNPKQGAGFLIGKEGLLREIELVEYALESRVPAMLTDLTNTVRYGDVCLMGNSDPVFIEVKSSKKLDVRGRRQRDELEKLHAFLQTDKAEALRGNINVRRTAYDEEPLDYVDQLRATIASAMKDGHCVTQPEPGLYYIVLTNPSAVPEVMNALSLKLPWFFELNEYKNRQRWSPYSPFTLTLEDRDQLWSFIRGEFNILIVLDLDRLVAVAKNAGVSAELDLDNENYPLRLSIKGHDAPAGVSSHLLTRIGLEFISPAWLIESTIKMMEKVAVTISNELADPPNVP